MIYRSSTINTRLYEVSSRVPSLKKHRLKHPIIIPPAIFSTRSFVYVKDASIISKQILHIRIRKKIIILHHPCILFLSFFYTHKINLCENSICNLHTLYTQDEMGENANENFSQEGSCPRFGPSGAISRGGTRWLIEFEASKSQLSKSIPRWLSYTLCNPSTWDRVTSIVSLSYQSANRASILLLLFLPAKKESILELSKKKRILPFSIPKWTDETNFCWGKNEIQIVLNFFIARSGKFGWKKFSKSCLLINSTRLAEGNGYFFFPLCYFRLRQITIKRRFPMSEFSTLRA